MALWEGLCALWFPGSRSQSVTSQTIPSCKLGEKCCRKSVFLESGSEINHMVPLAFGYWKVGIPIDRMAFHSWGLSNLVGWRATKEDEVYE